MKCCLFSCRPDFEEIIRWLQPLLDEARQTLKRGSSSAMSRLSTGGATTASTAATPGQRQVMIVTRTYRSFDNTSPHLRAFHTVAF